MPEALIRFALLHFALGMLVGVAAAAVLVLGMGDLVRTDALADRVLGFVMLSVSLGGFLGIASVATALQFAAEDG